MLFYIALIIVLAMLYYNIKLFKNKSNIVIPEKYFNKKIHKYSMNFLLSKAYIAVSSLSLILFFGFVSAFAGSFLGLAIFLSV